MARVFANDLWRPGRDVPFLVLCAALAAAMIRSVDQPAAVFHVAGTDVSITPTDVAVAVLGLLVVARVLGTGALPRPARAVTLAAGAFSAWLLLSSALNGAAPLVGAAKVLEYGVLALGAVLFVQRRAQLWLLVLALLAITVVADIMGLVALVRTGERQGAFLGSHDLPALGTLLLTVAAGVLLTRDRRLRWLGVAAAVAGALGVVLGAALASLVGMWLVVATVAALAAARRSLSWRPLVVMVAVAAAATAAAVPLRSGDLGFVESGAPALGAESAGGWSQRLIYTYIGWRVFRDNPVVGTGWHGQLPPSEWARYLDDAHRRFPEQPPNYFPRPTDELIPQQTYDQVLFELGIVGAVLFLALAAVAIRTAVRVGRKWPRGGPDEALAYVPVGWLAAMAGALAGAALFGGIPLMGLFWLALGVVALAPSLLPPTPTTAPPAPPREAVPAAR